MTAGRLVAIDRSNWQRTLAVTVEPSQMRFVADHQPIALVIMAKAYVALGGWEWEALGYEIECNEDDASGQHEFVAVLGLAHFGPIGQINNFAVDRAYQGRGIGRAVLDAVIDLARQRNWSTIRLTVSADNVAAHRLYSGAGFVPTGEVSNGEPILAVDLTARRSG